MYESLSKNVWRIISIFATILSFIILYDNLNFYNPHLHLTIFKVVYGEVFRYILYVQEVVTLPKILNRTYLYNLVHVTYNYFAL